MMKTAFFVFFLMMKVYATNQVVDNDFYEAQKRLIAKINSDSGITREILPMENSTKPVTVTIGLGIRQISTVDEVNQALRLNVWLRIKWKNKYLAWDPSKYNNMKAIHLSNDLIWTPDICMYNKASLEEEIDVLYKRLSTPIVVTYDGTCKWYAPATLLSQCKINVRQFPFDEQKCELKFGSWTYAAEKLDVVAGKATVDNFLPNGEWDIVGYPIQRNLQEYTSGNYPDVTLTFHIKRQPLYYTLNLILPCTVISILAFLSFVLPSSNGERVSLVITVLLAMSVYMLIVSSTLPQTSDAMPIIGTYFLCVIVEIALCLIVTCFIIRLRESEGEMPSWMDKFVNIKLARLLFVPQAKKPYTCKPRPKLNVNGNTKEISLTELQKFSNDDVMNELAYQKLLQKIRDEFSVLTDDVLAKQKREARQQKWHHAARVLDRFSLVLFSFIFVIVTASVFGSRN
ncbi:neuronal acetylcholine receptor subunit alpha-7-like isoform X2 [Xenia sp. Carnegie-2017]|uniref:neuronal acetylcholine receptor subunit alpha-7-like isoform X2 n=1 Tax=Xenia sp. Carnegie-2017 TaxID=2897299 RepID=UPI001F03C07C|nr:neuronal acetylcholine receptor subunit alpha-7-like isoform X2 [Xenia sp. Carnegie-2017]